MSTAIAAAATCPACGRRVAHGTFQSNYCLAFIAADYLRQHPRSTAWQIARGTGIDYERMAAAMPKARSLNLIYVDSDEDLGDGHRRYLFIAADRPAHRAELAERHRAQVARCRS